MEGVKMPSLVEIHASFIDQRRRVPTLGRPPVIVRSDRPIVAREKWVEVDDPRTLAKEFAFRRPEDRARFVNEVLEYESQVGHRVLRMVVLPESVVLHLRTRDVDRITELDKEMARYIDVVFKDIVLSSTSSP